MMNPMRILVRLVQNWKIWEITSRCCATLSAIGCTLHWLADTWDMKSSHTSSPVTHMNVWVCVCVYTCICMYVHESCPMQQGVNGTYIYLQMSTQVTHKVKSQVESYHTRERVGLCVYVYMYMYICICMYVHESCACRCARRDEHESRPHTNESCPTYMQVMSPIWTSHVTHMNDPCHTYERVMSLAVRLVRWRYVLVLAWHMSHESWVMSHESCPTHAYAFVCVYIYIYMYIYVCIYICVYIYIYIHMHVYIRMYMCIHIYTYLYI